MPADPFLLVIGAGAAGNACARTVARAGHSVVSVERDRVGGLCLWAGCMPKKALYNAAASARALSRMEQFGIPCQEARIDWPSVLAWKWHAQETYAGDQEGIARDAGIEIACGTAAFTSPGVVDVDGTPYRPEHILIATGSEPVLLDLPGAELADTTKDALSYPALPESLAIVGSGFIALEFAGIFASFGTKVSVLMRGDRVLRAYDPEVVDIAVAGLGELGVEFISGAAARSITGSPGSLELAYDVGDETRVLSVERVLQGIGRRPATSDLDLGAAGLETDERGRLVVHDHVRTSDPRVWVAGDAAGGPQFTSVASTHGSVVASALLGGSLEHPDYAAIPTAVFTSPQLAMVGVTEAHALESGVEHTVKRGTFEYVGAAIVADERRGLIKLLSDPGDRLIGAHIAGPEASDLIYPYALAINLGARTSDIAATRAAHPAFSESVNWAAY